VRTPDEVVFNQELRMDLMFLEDRQPVLHVVDSGTTFQAASFLTAEDANTVWNTFLKCWSNALCGYPVSILADQGSFFMPEALTEHCAIAEISLRNAGTESHNSLGSGERYYSPLRRVYQRVRMTNPDVPRDICLSAAVHAINSTAGPEGLVPALLVFGMIPKLPAPHMTPLLNQRRRFKMMNAAREEYRNVVSKLRVQHGIRTRPPAASKQVYVPGDSVYVYREKEKHWTGPHVVASVNGKDIALHLGEATGPRHFNVWQLKLSLLSVPVQFERSVRAAQECRVNWTEIVDRGDPRADSTEMRDAIQREISGLIERGIFRLVVVSEKSGKISSLRDLSLQSNMSTVRQCKKLVSVWEDTGIF
jgi:hypothetical protein